MRKSPAQTIVFFVIMALAVIGIGEGLYRMIFRPSTFNWSGLIVAVVIIGIIVFAFRSSPAFKTASKQPKIKPSARTMAKVKAQQGNYKNTTKSSPFAKTSSTGRSTATSTGSSKSKKHYPFQVIQGSKGKDDEEMPKYH